MFQSEAPKQGDDLTKDIIDDMIRELKHERDSKSKLAEYNQVMRNLLHESVVSAIITCVVFTVPSIIFVLLVFTWCC